MGAGVGVGVGVGAGVGVGVGVGVGGGALQSMMASMRRSATADVAGLASGTTWACTLRPLSPR